MASVDRDQHLRSLQLLKDLRTGGARIFGGHDPKESLLTNTGGLILLNVN